MTAEAESALAQQTLSDSVLQIFAFDPPLDLSLPIPAQVDALMHRSRLEFLNSAGFALFGGDRQLLGSSAWQMASRLSGLQDPPTVYLERLQNLVEARYQLENLSSMVASEHGTLFFSTSYFGETGDDGLHRLLVVHHPDHRGHSQDDIVIQLSQSLVTYSGEALLEKLLVNLCALSGMRFGMVAQLVKRQSGTFASTRVLCDRGQRQANMDYPLFGTPCEKVAEREICVFPNNVQQLFPEDALLVTMGIESYLGVPLIGADGQVIGLFSLLHDGPLGDATIARNLLQVFSVRAGAELEWLRHQQTRKLIEERRRLFFEQSHTGMYVLAVDPPMSITLSEREQVRWLAENCRYVECNPALVDVFGLDSMDQVVGRSYLDVHTSFDFGGSAREFISNRYQLADQVTKLIDADGRSRWVSFTTSGIVEDECLTTVIGVLTDISERMRYTQQLEYQASHDELTGLPNRSFFVDRVGEVIGVAEPGEQWAVCLLDLDGFKEINDTLGHEMGDHLLQGLASRVSDVVMAQGALLARIGGDEFALLYRYASEQEICAAIAEVVEAIQTPFPIHDLELRIGGSIGIALFPRDGSTTSSLMRCADIAMYKAKASGLDYQLYASEQDVYSIRRLSLMMDIRQAIEGDQLLLHYQPIVELPDQRVICFEALLRWEHPRLGLLPPGEFIPLIELTDMIEPMTWWVVEAAIRQLQAWRALGWEYRVSVNISARNVADERFAPRVAELLAVYEVPARQLELEITESALMADPDKARRVLQQLDAMGVWLSIDDYGTGYSSLAYLKSLPIDTLKIDRSFISHMLHDDQDRIIVNSTIQLAHNLGMSVTAEGIEYPELLDVLSNLGCDKAQGYHICRPVSAANLPAWVEAHGAQAYADDHSLT